MTKVGKNTWQTLQVFEANGKGKGFKFTTAPYDWGQVHFGASNTEGTASMWGADNIKTTNAGPYIVKFNDSTLKYTLTPFEQPIYIWNWVSKESPYLATIWITRPAR